MKSFASLLVMVLLGTAGFVAASVFGFERSLEAIAFETALVAGIITSVGVIYQKAIKPTIDHIHKVSGLMKDIEEVVEQHKNLDFPTLVVDVRKIIADIKPNSGSSLREAVDRIESRSIMMERTCEAFHQDGPVALFRCTTDGRNIDVNRTYCRLLKCTKEELTGYGWRNFLRASVDPSYDDVWRPSFEEGREVEFSIEFKDSDGNPVDLDVHAYPISDTQGEIVQYLGLLYPVAFGDYSL